MPWIKSQENPHRRRQLISIKRYMDAYTNRPPVDAPVSNEPFAVTMECYRSTLQAVGKGAAQACPAPGGNLELQLAKLVGQLPAEPAARRAARNIHAVHRDSLVVYSDD